MPRTVPTWELAAAKKIENLQSSPQAPLLVALVGLPGSGKSTCAHLLSDILNRSDEEDGGADQCLVLPMDGYHKPLSELKTPDEVYRRGAPDTFDAARLLEDLTTLKTSTPETMSFPGFDHAKGDPVEGEHTFVRSKHRIVLVEGLYLLLPSWRLSSLFEMSIFINLDIDICVERLKIRNLCIPGYTKEEIQLRCEEVDRVNAGCVLETSGHADLVVDAWREE